MMPYLRYFAALTIIAMVITGGLILFDYSFPMQDVAIAEAR